MRAGALNRRIIFERAVVTKDEFNSPVEKWNPIATVWASKQDISDGEKLTARQVGAEVTTRFQIRYSSISENITPKDRIILGDRIYNIVGIKEIGTREGFEITANTRADMA